MSTTENHSDLKVFLKPYFIVMTILGVYSSPGETNQVDDFTVDSSKRTNMIRCRRIVYKAYQILMLLSLWLQVIRYTVSLFIAQPIISQSSIYRLCILIFSLQVAITTTVYFRMFSKKDRFCTFLERWIELSKKAASLGLKQDIILLKVKRMVRVFLVIMFFAYAITGSCFIVPQPGENELIKAIKAPSFNSKPWDGLTYMFWIFHSAIWLNSIPFFAAVTTSLALQFKLLSDEITELVNTAKSFPAKIHQFKRLHLELCELVGLLNRDFKCFVASAFLLNILVLLCVGYSVIKTALVDVSLITMLATIAVISSYKLVSLAFISAHLHEQIHKPLPSLYKLRGQNANLEDMLGVNLFIAKLQESSVGITAMNILLVKQGTLLTLFGVFLTYLFVVIQFSL